MTKTIVWVSVSYPLHRASPNLEVGCNGIFPHSFMGEEQDTRSGDDPCIVFPFMYDTLCLGKLLSGELYDVLVRFVHIPPAYHATPEPIKVSLCGTSPACRLLPEMTTSTCFP